MAVKTKMVIVFSVLVGCWFSATKAQTRPPIVNGLSWTFYNSSCPKVESIIRKELKKVFENDIGQAAGLLRLHFHDCFVLGCDGSVLVNGSSEKTEIPNLTLRNEAFEIVNNLRALVHKQCGPVVSCSDILTIAARDSVVLSGGPNYDVPLGRRDGVTFAAVNATFTNLVGPTANVTTILTRFARKNLDTTDSVSLSGGHTIGIGHCTSFTERLYPTQDATMDKTFANNLKLTCPKVDTQNTTVLDIRSPNKFDNKYYVDLMNKQGLFTSDQDLYTDKRTRQIVIDFAVNQTLFYEKFVLGMIKMGQIEVLTGQQGEIRNDCSLRNSDTVLVSAVEEETGGAAEMR